MLRHREAVAIALIALTGALVGCDADPFSNVGASDEGAFVAVGLSGVGGTDGLTATADAVTSESATISLPEDILDDAPNEAFLAVSAADIAVVINGVPAGRSNPVAKAQERHAAITFRLANENQEPCDSLDQIGPFEITITDGVVTLAADSLPLGASARSIVRNGRFEMCAETLADFDGSITVGSVSFEFGRLRGGEELVTLCHIPPGDANYAHTITVGASAEAHLAHGDYVGECEEQDENPADGDWDDDGSEDADDDADDDGSSGDGDDADDEGGDDSGGDDTDDDGEDNTDEGNDDDADTDENDLSPDSDGDGVSDDTDECDGTPADESADDGGCSCSQRDGDGDGRDDCGDACPSTESDVVVDATGCADSDFGDDDGDGVSNGTDDCPDTTNGEAVDETGCSCAQTDADSDGVDDCSDTCANTTVGLSVDANGCASSQLDDDSDGVTDDADACPSTPAGETIDVGGCSCSQLDADGDGVNDCNDVCSGTPQGDGVGADGCTLVTIDVDAGPDLATMVGVSIDVVGTATVLTGDYAEASLVYVWEQVGGGTVTLDVSGPSLNVDTTGATGDVVLRMTASTSDGSASGTDEFTIAIDTNAVTVDSASCDPTTGHCYILARNANGSNEQLWWDDAKTKANRMVYNGMRGHLPTITSLEERQFLAGVASNTPAMLGGSDSEEEGTWKWADGPESGQLIEYLPWADSEPNDLYHWTYPEGEDYLQFEARGFNDINGARWYYVEFEPGW